LIDPYFLDLLLVPSSQAANFGLNHPSNIEFPTTITGLISIANPTSLESQPNIPTAKTMSLKCLADRGFPFDQMYSLFSNYYKKRQYTV
jgi:hypothetical protein